MSFRHDQRGQAIQVGAVLLFAVLIIAFSTYQAVIVPADNERVEFNHNQEVQDHLAELRNAVLGTAEATSTRSISVALGTQYPSRTLGLNPNAPGGSLRTVGTSDPMVNLTIENATVAGESGDFWNGSARSYNTGAIQYRPEYHRYDEAPDTSLEHSVLYNRFPSSNVLISANQTFIDGDRLSIVTLNGSLDRTASRSTSVAVRPASTGGERVLATAQDQSSPITLTFASRLSVDRWEGILQGEDAVIDVGPGSSTPGGDFNAIRVELDPDEQYHLGMTKAAIGQGATAEGSAYLTDVSGDGASVQRGTSQQLTLAVRDRFNNPVGGVEVNGTVDGSSSGALESTNATTDTSGEATFTYETPSGTTPTTHEINFTTQAEGVLAGDFDPETTENVTMEVDVTPSGGAGGGGAYDVEWTDPSGEDGNRGDSFGSCDSETCVWDVGASSNSELDLNATLSPVFEGVDLEFAVSNSTVGTVSPGSAATASNGAATTLTANANGTVDVLASGNDGSARITIDVENVTDGGGGTSPALSVLHEDLSNTQQNQGNFLVSYEVSNAPGDFDKVAVHFVNNDDSQDTAWRNSTATAGTVTYQDGDAGGDAYDVEMAAYDSGGNAIATWSVSDDADGVNTGASDDLGDTSSPTFTSHTISDDSNNGQMRYNVSYIAESSGFDRVDGYLIAQNPSSGEDSETFDSSSDSGTLSTYGFSNSTPRDMKTSLLLFDDRGIVVDRITWVDGGDGSGESTG